MDSVVSEEKKKSIVTKVWDYFNGKKTVIGTTGLSIATIVDRYAPDGHWTDIAAQVSMVIFGLLAGTGVVHKGTKGEIKRAKDTLFSGIRSATSKRSK